MKSQALIALGVLTTTTFVSHGGGIDFSWANAQDGDWISELSWNTGTVPGAADHVLLGLDGPYVVTLGGTQSAGSLSLTNQQAVLLFSADAVLKMYGDLENNGRIMLFPGFATVGAGIHAERDMRLRGIGVLQIVNSGSQSRIQSHRGSTVTQTSTHTIEGHGYIDALMINNGLIQANVKGERMRLVTNDKQNAGSVGAVSGGIISLNGIEVVQSEAGKIFADGIGSQAELVDITIRGGSLLSSDGANIEIAGVSTIDGGRFDGRMHVLGGSTMRLENSWTNDGTVVINSDRAWAPTSLDVVNALTLDGEGSIQLSYAVDRASVNSIDGAVLTQGPDHSIRGRGQVSAALVNNGLVSADVSGTPLRLNGEDKTNNAVFEAVQSGILELYDMTISQGESGQIRADGIGSTVDLVEASVEGGELVSTDGGVLTYRGYGRLSDVRLHGLMTLKSHSSLRISGSWTNCAVITFISSFSRCELFFEDSMLISGDGVFNMDTLTSRISTAEGQVVTNGAEHTIYGQGSISAEMINEGRIISNLPQTRLKLWINNKTNNASMEAVNSGALDFREVTVTQGPNGFIKADGLDSEIKFMDASIIGGRLQSKNNAAVNITGLSKIEGVDFSGLMNIPGGNTLAIKGGVLNNGTIVVNSPDSQEPSAMQWDEPTTLFGAGAILLQSPASVLRTGEGVTGGGLGPDQRLEGVGEIRLPLTNEGTIAPGLGLGTMLATQPVEFTSAAVYEIEVNEVAGDVLESTSTITLRGSLDVRFIEDFAPVGYWSRTVMRANDIAGRFDTVLIPDAPHGFVTRVINTGSELVIGQTLAADLTLDGVLDFFDISAFLDAYGSAEIDADWNSDGAIDAFDVMGFLEDFNGH